MTLQDSNNNVRDTHDIEGVLLHMGFQDYAAQHYIELNENDNVQYERVSLMYFSENTREGHQSCIKILLLFLDDKNQECVSDYAKRALQDAFPSGATVKHNNKAVISWALQLIKSANSTSQPINFEAVTNNFFVEFLFGMARNNTDGNKYLSKSGCGSYRSAFKYLYPQYQVSVPQYLEAALTKAFKGFLRAHSQEKEAKGSHLSEGKDPMSFPYTNDYALK